MNQMTRTLLLLMLIGVLAAACKKEESTLTVTTDEVTDITHNSALCGGEVVDRHVSKYSFTMGICWSTTSKPTASDSSYSFTSQNGGSYSHPIKWLTSNTTYYVRAYANNGSGNVYGNTVSFTTLPSIQPEIKNAYPTYVTRTTAQLEGEVTSDGGATITARGVCWSTGENPTVADSKTVDGEGIGKYTSMLTGLTANYTYYVRAYATNAVGTTYGSNIVVRTMNGTVTDIDGNVYQTVQIGTQEWMAENLKVTHYRNGDPITNITDDAQWHISTSGAWCSYDNKTENKDIYGLLYNQYTVVDSRGLCPIGWHIPSYDEWGVIFSYLGGIDNAGDKMRKAGMNKYDNHSTNSSGFTALLGGSRGWQLDGVFRDINEAGLWCDTDRGGLILRFNETHLFSGYYTIGTSARCLKDN